MKVRLSLLTAFFTAFLLAPAAHASPWARDAGGFLMISGANYFSADLEPEMTSAGLVKNRFERTESNTYFEFGLTPKITLGGKVIYGASWLTRNNRVETATGFSEIEIFGQHQIFRTNGHTGSIKFSASIPANFKSGVRAELESDGVDLDIAALYGRNLKQGPVKIFATSEFGLKKRISDSADQFHTEVIIGIEPNSKWLLLAETFAIVSLQNERNFGADYDIIKIQPSAVWRGGRHWALQAGVSEEVAGRNIALGRTIFISLWSSF